MKVYYYIYFMTSQNNNVLYTGMTNNIERRVAEHKSKMNRGFTQRYNCNKLVFFEKHLTALGAIQREKQIKSGSRKKKDDLVNSFNPEWRDLSLEWE